MGHAQIARSVAPIKVYLFYHLPIAVASREWLTAPSF
jgi:hypothetical protein